MLAILYLRHNHPNVLLYYGVSIDVPHKHPAPWKKRFCRWYFSHTGLMFVGHHNQNTDVVSTAEHFPLISSLDGAYYIGIIPKYSIYEWYVQRLVSQFAMHIWIVWRSGLRWADALGLSGFRMCNMWCVHVCFCLCMCTMRTYYMRLDGICFWYVVRPTNRPLRLRSQPFLFPAPPSSSRSPPVENL